jgi:hypothetical protein
MNTTDSYRGTDLGVEAGWLAPAHTLGEDTEPLPVRLRVMALAVIVCMVVSLVVVIQSVPSAANAWQVLSKQTERTLEPVLGESELQTTRMLGSLAGSDLDETVSATSQPTK